MADICDHNFGKSW